VRSLRPCVDNVWVRSPQENGETLQAQDDRRKSVSEQNDQRTDIDETMGEGGGDEEEDGE
jgi:hypothetical protein